jgi:hypothetical protein
LAAFGSVVVVNVGGTATEMLAVAVAAAFATALAVNVTDVVAEKVPTGGAT